MFKTTLENLNSTVCHQDCPSKVSRVIAVWSPSLDLFFFMIDFSSFYEIYNIHCHSKHGHFMWLLCTVVLTRPCSTVLFAYSQIFLNIIQISKNFLIYVEKFGSFRKIYLLPTITKIWLLLSETKTPDIYSSSCIKKSIPSFDMQFNSENSSSQAQILKHEYFASSNGWWAKKTCHLWTCSCKAHNT